MTTERAIWFTGVAVLTFPILLAAFQGDDGITSTVILRAVGVALVIAVGTAWLFGTAPRRRDEEVRAARSGDDEPRTP